MSNLTKKIKALEILGYDCSDIKAELTALQSKLASAENRVRELEERIKECRCSVV